MHKIRKSVFETNSSSSHSLTLSSNELAAQPFSKDVLRAGALSLYKGEYGWEWYRYYSVIGKLNYLLTQLFTDDIPNGDALEVTNELREQDHRFDMLCKVVKEHTGVDILVSPGSTGYIDHDSVGVGLEAFHSEDKLRSLLFSEENYIETGNDNSGPAWTIGTDRGDEFYYRDFFWEPGESNVTVGIKLVSHWDLVFETAKGARLSREHNPELYQQLLSKATVLKADWTSKGRYSRFEYEEPRGATAAMFAQGEDGIRFSPNLEVSVNHIRTEDYGDSFADLTVSVPADLVEALKKLPKTKLPKKESN